MIPSSLATADPSIPSRSRIRAFTASAHGACRHPVGGVQDEPPVADLVASAFDRQRAIGRQRPGRLSLLREVREEIPAGVGVEAGLAQTRIGDLRLRRRHFAGESAQRLAQLGGTAQPVTVPERHLARLPNAGTTFTRSWVMSTIRQLVVPSVKTSFTRDS